MTKRLSLTTEKLRVLVSDDLSQVNGGERVNTECINGSRMQVGVYVDRNGRDLYWGRR